MRRSTGAIPLTSHRFSLGQWTPYPSDFFGGAGSTAAPSSPPYEPARSVEKGTRDVILQVIADKRGRTTSVTTWYDTALKANVENPSLNPNPQTMLGPDLGGYKQALTTVSAYQDLVDTVEWRLSHADPSIWLLKDSEMDAIRVWSNAVDTLTAIVKRRVPAANIPTSVPEGPGSHQPLELKQVMLAAAVAGLSYGLSAIL